MSEDVLVAATRALREETGNPDAARFTRARVMASLHRRERRRSTKIAFLLPIAAVLVGSTAWGAASGRLPSTWQEVSAAVGISAAPSPAALARPAERAAALVRSAPARAARPVPASVPIAAEPTPEPDSAPAAPVAVAPTAAQPAPAADPAHELYRSAHRLHFASADAAGARAAWDAYLAAAPRGRFATEARYNRALCLVRLGRGAEARAALAPFAEGRFGGYRQREASELMDALGAK